MRTSVGGSGRLSLSRDSEDGPLVGRARELTALRDLMTGHRLVTVTGSVGVGKSRLAGEASVAGPWQRVVRVRWRGRGAAVPGALSRRVAEELAGRRGLPRGTDLAATAAALPTAATLLVLDDVDAVHLECVGVVQRLLMAAPALRLLVTSRRALGVGEERVLRLTPLGCREPHDPDGPSAAAELFLARARAVVDGFSPGEPELRAIDEVCALLEGVPLAIGLAARQLTAHPVADLPALLAGNQCWLTGDARTVPRHRSLREALGADYLLCEDGARTVWGRASVLAGPFTEPTAVFVCAGGEVAPEQVPVCLARLVSSGVLEPLGDTGGVRAPRYRMTRAARDFGLERLTEAGELPVAAERRMLHSRQTAAVAENLWSTGSQRQAVELVRSQRADLLAALHHACAHPDHAEWAVETVVGLWFWWVVYGHAEEGREALLRLLPLCPAGSPALVQGWWLAAWLCADPDLARAGRLLDRAWRTAVLAGDDAAIGRVAHVQGALAWRHDDARAAALHFQQAAETIPAHAPGGPSPAVSLAALAVAQTRFAPRDARRSARRALTHPSVRTDAWATLLARSAQAHLDRHEGRGRRAARRARRVLAALDPALPEPRGTADLRQLLADTQEPDDTPDQARRRERRPNPPQPREAPSPLTPSAARTPN
ncbi:ATP-binding protein [Streptomyces sp. NPDC090106]|uniref:ATP-binding protein n=1 Tax=Streptomyces sp. NPDC090106 TaxID=3365946 RepID=UPI003809118F